MSSNDYAGGCPSGLRIGSTEARQASSLPMPVGSNPTPHAPTQQPVDSSKEFLECWNQTMEAFGKDHPYGEQDKVLAKAFYKAGYTKAHRASEQPVGMSFDEWAATQTNLHVYQRTAESIARQGWDAAIESMNKRESVDFGNIKYALEIAIKHLSGTETAMSPGGVRDITFIEDVLSKIEGGK